MEALLRKYFWAADALAISLCAVFLGRAAASAVESGMSVPPARATAFATHVPPQPTVYPKDIGDIIHRNVFCSTCPPIKEKEDEPTTETAVDTTPQKTSLPLALMAIMYSPPPGGIKWSVAVIRDTEDKSTGPYGVGGKVHGATITEIQETRIYLDNSGKTEYLDLLEQNQNANQGNQQPQQQVAAAPTPGSDPLAQELDRGIKKLSDHTFEIQRGTLESVLGNMNMLSRSARIVPEIRDGKSAGFRLYSVRPDGPFAKIGMQNGDVISSINGLEITSPEKALEVYSKLKSASHLSVGLERNGQKVTMDYGIR